MPPVWAACFFALLRGANAPYKRFGPTARILSPSTYYAVCTAPQLFSCRRLFPEGFLFTPGGFCGKMGKIRIFPERRERCGTAVDTGKHPVHDRPGGGPPAPAGQRRRGTALSASAAPGQFGRPAMAGGAETGCSEAASGPGAGRRLPLRRPRPAAGAPEAPPPEYSLEEISTALSDRTSSFPLWRTKWSVCWGKNSPPTI